VLVAVPSFDFLIARPFFHFLRAKRQYMPYDDEEIKRLLKEKRHRGKKTSPPPTSAVARKKLEGLQLVENLLAKKRFSRFKRRLTECGPKIDSEEYQMAVAAFFRRFLLFPFIFHVRVNIPSMLIKSTIS
jgi:hypothetical protein